MPKPATDQEVFEILLAGTSADEVQLYLDQLTAEDRQAVLCTACYLLDELAANCHERSEDIGAFIAANCPMLHCSGPKAVRPDSSLPALHFG
jgi:hypothetical protein